MKKARESLLTILLTGFICLVIPISALGADKLVVKDGSGDDVFTVEDNGAVTSDGTSFPVSKIRRTVSHTTAGRGVAAFELISTGNMVDGFGPSFEFWISDNAHTASKAVVALVAARDGGDQSGKFEILTAYGGTLEYSMAIDSNGYVGIGTRNPEYLIDTGYAYCNGNTWVNASSREYKEDIKELTRDEAMDTLEGLKPVNFRFKKDPEDRHLGFISEDVPELVATRDRKGMSPMDVVAVLTKVVQEQQKAISELSKEMADLKKKLSQKGTPTLARVRLSD